MNDRVLVTINVPEIGKDYNVFIPYNDRLYNIIDGIVAILYELSEKRFDVNKRYYLFNEDDGTFYDKNTIVNTSNIKNMSKLILFGF